MSRPTIVVKRNLPAHYVVAANGLALLHTAVAIPKKCFRRAPHECPIHGLSLLHLRFQALSSPLLDDALEIHLVQLACYNLREVDLGNASALDRWLFWLLHAHEYSANALLAMFPEPAMQTATQVLIRIAEQSEDKRMYDLREKAIRDKAWELNATFAKGKAEGKAEGMAEGKAEGIAEGKAEGIAEGKAEGKAEGRSQGRLEGQIESEIRFIQLLQQTRGLNIIPTEELLRMSLEELQALTGKLASGL